MPEKVEFDIEMASKAFQVFATTAKEVGGNIAQTFEEVSKRLGNP
ncbi:hypothetical protein [Paenibacillus apiarius]